MFDLKNAVNEWSQEFAGSSCGRSDRVEELKDHLFCEIEANINEGLNEESAFLAATRRFGISEELKKEFRKGRSIASLLCDAEAEMEELGRNPKRLAVATGIYLVLFAALTFGLAFFLRGSDTFPYATPVLYCLSLIPVFFALFLNDKSRSECSPFKRLWRKVFD